MTVNAKLTLDNVTVSGTTITDNSSIELDNNVTLTGGATIQGGPITNLGTLEIAGAATLLNDSLTNTDHTVQVDAGQTLTLDNTGITGGTLAISGTLDSTGIDSITVPTSPSPPPER